MRKTALFLAAILLVSARSIAQTSTELIPSAGYTFADRNDYYGAYSRIADGVSYGGSIKFNINRGVGIEVLYSHMNTNSGLYNYGPDHTPISATNLSMDYIMAGPIQSFTIPNSTVRPFIGAMLGAAIITPAMGSGFSQTTDFAMGFQLGTNIYLSPRTAIQLKAQLLSPVDAAGTSFFFSNYGSGVGINGYSSTYQFSLGGGLIIGLGRVLPAQTYRPARRPHPRYYPRYYY